MAFIQIKKKPLEQGLFKPKPKIPLATDFDDIYKSIKEVSRRLRELEERNTNFQRKLQIIEQNMISKNKQLNTEIRAIDLEISTLKKDLFNLKDQILMLIKELQECAKKEELNVINNYLNLWKPVKFVTHNEIEDIVKDIVEKVLDEGKKEQQ